MTAANTMASAPSDACPYTVQKGDTLIRIAAILTGKPQNYPLIMKFNALSSDRIAPGQVLHIPFDLLLPEHRCQPEATPVSAPPPKDKKFLAEIEAFVFEDANGNREFEEGEPGIAGVKLILVKGRIDQPPLTGVTGITSENGQYIFKNVEPGSRAVGLYETTLPTEASLITESTVAVTVPEGSKTYVNFAVRFEKNYEKHE